MSIIRYRKPISKTVTNVLQNKKVLEYTKKYIPKHPLIYAIGLVFIFPGVCAKLLPSVSDALGMRKYIEGQDNVLGYTVELWKNVVHSLIGALVKIIVEGLIYSALAQLGVIIGEKGVEIYENLQNAENEEVQEINEEVQEINEEAQEINEEAQEINEEVQEINEGNQ